MSKFLSNVKPVNWICWTDSMTTLCWIKNERIWKQFVQHRVNKIRELTSKEVWRHCPGELNQADIPSRDQSGKDLSQNTTWWNGPSFLYLPQTDWPKQQGTQCNNDIALQEARKGAPTITYSMANASLEEKPPRLEEVIDPKTIQWFIKLLRVTALVMKFISKLRCCSRNPEDQAKGGDSLTAAGMNEAEILWVKSIQADCLPEELRFLTTKTSSNCPNNVRQFGLYLDEGKVVRCNGRIGNSTLPTNSRSPILMPSKHEFVK
jgi:hypothetical protein